MSLVSLILASDFVLSLMFQVDEFIQSSFIFSCCSQLLNGHLIPSINFFEATYLSILKVLVSFSLLDLHLFYFLLWYNGAVKLKYDHSYQLRHYRSAYSIEFRLNTIIRYHIANLNGCCYLKFKDDFVKQMLESQVNFHSDRASSLAYLVFMVEYLIGISHRKNWILVSFLDWTYYF